MVPLRSLPLERFPQLSAVLLLAACPLVALADGVWPLALAAALGFGLLLAARRGRYTPQGSFGSANGITALRLAGVVALAVLGLGWPGYVVAALAVSLMLLDGVDGLLARRFGAESDFGAAFDVEVDALLVLVLGALLWQRERFGAWILWPGLLRHGYVLTLAVRPGSGHEPRSLLGRFGFGAVVAGMLAGFVDGGRAGTVLAACGALIVTASFGRSLYYSYGKSAR